MVKEIEPHAYGDHFNSVEELIETVNKRVEDGLSPYGHALIYLEKDGKLQRIASRVGFNGDIMVGAHTEWI